MKTTLPHRDRPVPLARRSIVSALAAATALTLAAPAAAADWFLDKNQAQYTSWATLADWKPNADGTGTSPGALSSADTYHFNGFILRTPELSTSSTFGGGVLVLDAGELSLKHTNSAVATIPSLVTMAGLIENDGAGTKSLQVGHYENRSGSTAFAAASGEGIHLDIGTLVGSGQFRFYGGGVFGLSIGSSPAYDGEIYVQSGQLDFNSDVATAGKLTVNTGARVVLDQTVTVTGLTIAGTAYSPDTYTFDELQAAHPLVFTSGGSGGAIVVRPPRNWYLSTHQPIGASWNTLAHWRANSDGTGATADSVNSFDNYINQVSGRTLRTPEVTDTFGGGSLVLASGANLTLKAPAGKTSTIPAFATSGTVTITNGFSGITQPLIVGDWDIASGVTQLSVPGTSTVQLTVDTLSGAGTLQFQNGGKYVLSLHHANKFTGTLRHYSGTLTIDRQIGTNGPLVVESGAKLILNKPGFFTSIKIGSTFLAPGFHSYASLRASHAAYFPAGGSSTAFLAVHAPDLTGPVQMYGVNISGPESMGGSDTAFPGTYGHQWIYPTTQQLDYYASKNLKLIRIPFRWERMQPTRGGDLSAAERGRMDTFIAAAKARGMKVILDMHNYARWKPAGTTGYPPQIKIGEGGVTVAQFANVWERLATHYKNEDAIWAYGIMNEPHGTGGTWPATAQAAIDAIRKVDLTHHVLVPGEFWSNATGWIGKNPNIHLNNDPVGRMIYEAHCYFDSNLDGVYGSYSGENGSPTLGVQRVREFVEWIQARGARGFIGEYAVPRVESTLWNETLRNFMEYIQDAGISGTYWAGGAWWPGSNVTNCEPTNNFTTDRPVMDVLEDFTGAPSP